MDCNESRKLLDAYADDELDAPSASRVEAHLRDCAPCRDALAARASLRAALKQAAYFDAPAGLAAHIRRSLPAGDRRWHPRALVPFAARFAPAAVALVFATWVGLLYLWPPGAEEQLTREIVDGHVRSLMASHLADVASSDQHTVKPWFSGKLDFSPPVNDFAASGYALTGGRLDYIGGRAVAALVYRHRQHVINLFVWPDPAQADAPPALASSQGFHLARWRKDGMSFRAVSDMNEAELNGFVVLMLAAAGG
ncbi:MAG TPA: anti-sigma factor [Burkholderiales bacterium]|nr:anti-sigma factor [Burkholderiales bacterium]